MSKARILADYVAGGTTAAEFDYMDGVTSNVQTQMDAKAPLASPVLVTPNLGTPSAGVVTNLSGVLPVGVTGGSGLTALGTVTEGNLSNTAIVYPAGHVLNMTRATSQAETNTLTESWINYYETSYQFKSANSILYIEWYSTTSYISSSGGFGVRLYRNTSSTVTDSHTEIDDQNLYTTGGDASYNWHTNGTAEYQSMQRWFTDNGSHSASDTWHYGVFYRRYDSTAVQVPLLGNMPDHGESSADGIVGGGRHGLVFCEVRT